ncbi:hypothetical protein EN942_05075 [Mesorhizobium sp. M7A.F.Ca.CA.001.14.1.1]|nr:hypothetical protein EN942_05075 [Mesorhizobium sp. M7A.F.Ca.CA.001.14.1.1]
MRSRAWSLRDFCYRRGAGSVAIVCLLLFSTRAVHRFTETANRSNSLSWRNSGRKTVSHFSWNCS